MALLGGWSSCGRLRQAEAEVKVEASSAVGGLLPETLNLNLNLSLNLAGGRTVPLVLAL
jgi:hypothetical protein